ncbi:hypothetical protein DFJ77DRAFT_286680 [Powellomyces hirtus]|nr:hypothetical protein DFJ77DRAFT_286680 [Powellomyces hirtus]
MLGHTRQTTRRLLSSHYAASATARKVPPMKCTHQHAPPAHHQQLRHLSDPQPQHRKEDPGGNQEPSKPRSWNIQVIPRGRVYRGSVRPREDVRVLAVPQPRISEDRPPKVPEVKLAKHARKWTEELVNGKQIKQRQSLEEDLEAPWTKDLNAPVPAERTARDDEAERRLVATLQAHNAAAVDELLGWVTDKSDRMRNLSSDTVHLLLTELIAHGATRKLQLHDWRRLFQHLVGRTPFKTLSPPDTARRGIWALKEMKQCSVEPDAFIYACLIRAVKDDVKEVVTLHTFLKKRYRTLLGILGVTPVLSDKVFRTLLAAYLHRANTPPYLARARSLLTDMKDLHMAPSTETCLGFLEAYSTYHATVERDSASVVAMHSRMKVNAKNRVLEGRACYGLLAAHDACGHYKAVVKLVEQMREQGVPLRFSAYKRYMKANMHEHLPRIVIRTFHEMQDSGLGADDECYALMMDALVMGQDAAGIAAAHEELRAQLVPGAGSDAQQEAATRLQGKVSVKAYDALVIAYCKLGKWEKALEAYKELKELRFKAFAAVENAEQTNTDNDVPNDPPQPPTTSSSSAGLTLKHPKKETALPSRTILRHVTTTLALANQLTHLHAFIHTEVLDPARLHHYWSRTLAGTERQTRLQCWRLERELRDARQNQEEEADHRKHVVGRIAGLEARLAQKRKLLEKQRGQPVVETEMKVGLEGPLKVVYQGLADAWRTRVEQAVAADDQADQFMKMELMLQDAYSEERRRVGAVLAEEVSE